MRKNYVEIAFLNCLYGIDTINGKGLDDLVYDLKLNEAIDNCYDVNNLYDLKELFQDGLIKMVTTSGFKGDICSTCNNPIYSDDDFCKIKGKLYCKNCN